MNTPLTIPLNTTPQQAERLIALQTAFAEACNALAPIVREQRCWHRVTLHHLTYRSLRERFPQLGSQMICNAIYSVCRASRLVYQNPNSPFNIQQRPHAPLPLLKFAASAPVYFDRHTLSLKDGKLSMYTLDGRMHFQLTLQATDEQRFDREKLHEIVLSRTPGGFELRFHFHPNQAARGATQAHETVQEWPEYLLVQTRSPAPEPACESSIDP